MKNERSKTTKLKYRTILSALWLTSLLFLFTTHAKAQNNWGLTFRTAANFPTTDLGDAKLKTGIGVEGTIDYKFVPSLAVYAGWGWNKFSADKSFAGSNMDFEETGYRYGLQFTQVIGDTRIKYSISAGGLWNHIETENTNGEITSDSGHGFGWEVDGGLHIPIGERFSLIPAVRYHSLSREVMINSSTTDVDLNYLAVSAALRWSF